MIKDIREINFPDYATLDQATVTINDMGDRSISTQVKIDGSIVPDFSYDWEVEFKGEKYIHPVREPQSTKDNTSMSAKIDMVFYHWAIYEMKRHYFVEMASTSAGTAIADKYIASLGLNLSDFITAFNLVLNHYFEGKIVANLNPDWQYDAEAQFMSISYSYIWDVLQQIYEIYGVRWTIKTNADGVCEILVGYPAEEVSHVFEYGFEGGLLSVQRHVHSTDIRNRLLGRGGEKNLPYRYFKDKDPNNPLFEADPDWIPELANIAFTELRGKTFRDYVKGWKAQRYGGEAMAEPTDAYLAGYSAEKFDPIEYVEDEESIAKYGVLIGALENNEDIYPSIQGAPGDVDKIVDAEQVINDDVTASTESDAVVSNLKPISAFLYSVEGRTTVTLKSGVQEGATFSVPEGKAGNLDASVSVSGFRASASGTHKTAPILKADTIKVILYRKTVGISQIGEFDLPVVNIPPGDYYYGIMADVDSNDDDESSITLNMESVHMYVSTPESSDKWKPTFDIWVRNIWNSSRNDGETDEQYADRVWAPILGDRAGEEASVVFTSGWLSFSSDWEFPIEGYAYDDSKEGSHWRLTLSKSEAELDASGKYIPNKGTNASAGDRFFFIGIDMPYQYVLWAEERLDNYKRDSLLQTAEINPTWVVKTDKVRLNEDREGYKLIDSLTAGSQIRLASKQFIAGPYESLYVQSVVYTWSADTLLYPNVEIVVSNKVFAVKNPIIQIQSSIDTLQKQVGSISNIQQIVRQVGDTLYLRKDGISDVSKSPTKFLGKVTGENFRQGLVGGKDWGIYRDEDGKSIAEFDKLIIREILSVAQLETNHVTHIGGTRVMSKAEMECIAVTEVADGYICYFDPKLGTKINLFAVDDIVWSQTFDAENIMSKYYKSVVIATGDDHIKLAKNQYDGDGIPSVGDVIIQAGNVSDENRQSVIVIDSTGNPSITLYRGVNSFVFPDPETRIQSGNNLFTGLVHMAAGSTIPQEALGDLSDTITNAIGNLEFGKYNLLRNSGFTGDFVTESLDNGSVLDEDSQMFSDPLRHWSASNVAVQDSSVGQSGKEIVLTSGILSQELHDKIISGENYVLSFRCKGVSFDYSVGGVSGTVALDDQWTKVVHKFTATSDASTFAISNANATICDLQLERGTVQSAWGHSMWDNQSELAKYQSMQYLEAAMKNGSTDVLGGLILTNLILLGNPEASDNNAGISGIRNDDNDVAFWGGGTYAQAIDTVMKYVEDPTYKPTTEELASMAKAVITHGGRAILNDVIVRGTVYAEDGQFSGRIDATSGKIGDFDITRGIQATTSEEGGSVKTVAIEPSRVGITATYAASGDSPATTGQVTLMPGPTAGISPQTFSSIVRTEITDLANDDETLPTAITNLILGAKGAREINRRGFGGNHAIWIEDGMVAGLRPRMWRITESDYYQLRDVDHTIVTEADEVGIELILPSEPKIGQTYKIWKQGSHTLYINPNGKQIANMGVLANSETRTFGSTFFGTIELIYRTNQGWLMVYVNNSTLNG